VAITGEFVVSESKIPRTRRPPAADPDDAVYPSPRYTRFTTRVIKEGGPVSDESNRALVDLFTHLADRQQARSRSD
jgi:hypothetical protein